MTLGTPIEKITSIGRKIGPSLKKLGLGTARDLIFYWPFRYEDWSHIKSINEILAGEAITIRGTIEMIQNKRSRFSKRMVTEAIITDNTGSIRAVWFHQPYLVKNFKSGDEIFLSGKVEMNESGLQFVHPNYEKITKRRGQPASRNGLDGPTHTARIVPIYSLTRRVTQKQLRYLISQVLSLANRIPEWLPQDILKKYNLPSLLISFKQIHFPNNYALLNLAQHRLKFNELLLINLRAQINKQNIKKSLSPVIKFKKQQTQEFVKNLPFKLTNSQRKTSWEIIRDLEKNKPMNRLLEGDVGSGKTVVAALGILNVLLNNYQAAYMAPTEILARQQFQTFNKLFEKYEFKIALLTGSQVKISNSHSGGPRQANRCRGTIESQDSIASLQSDNKNITKNKLNKLISSGEIDLIIGTHALIQEKVNFSKLALAIIDEQHRFGVKQRSALLRGQTRTVTRTDADGQRESALSPRKSALQMPHLLSMSATPIPRSLALTLYGDLDLSIINEMPPNRLAVKTKLVPPEKRGEHYKFIKDEIQKHRQVFVICPLIDPSDKLGKKAATEEFEKLNRQVFPDFKIGLVHGKLKSKDKEKVMQEFANGNLDILVATPVIEVGIDIPNATVMMVESAERFGLAQLHQFRGRVGRGNYQSYCLLFTESTSTESLKRLQALVESNDGFDLAQKDLEFRGPGEVYGMRQHGFDDMLKIARLTDYAIIKEVHEAVPALLTASPNLTKFPQLKRKLDEFESNIHLE